MAYGMSRFDRRYRVVAIASLPLCMVMHAAYDWVVLAASALGESMLGYVVLIAMLLGLCALVVGGLHRAHALSPHREN